MTSGRILTNILHLFSRHGGLAGLQCEATKALSNISRAGMHTHLNLLKLVVGTLPFASCQHLLLDGPIIVK